MQYWASETSTRFGRVRSGFRSGDGTCGIWSEAIDNDTSVVRVYKGDVNYLYRDTPNARYTLLGDDVQYPIAYVETDGSVRHRDFLSFFNRNEPWPAGLVEISSTYRVGAYYLPVNFSATALDTLTALPADDRPYLDDSICSGDECPAWEEPICPPSEEEVAARSVSVVSQASGSSSGSGGDGGSGDVAHSQTPQVLVSNIEQTKATAGGTEFGVAQAFRTGANTDGYRLIGIDLRLSLGTTPTVTLRRGSVAGSTVASFTAPSTTTGTSFADIRFTPTTTVTLDSNTDYWVVAAGGNSLWVWSVTGPVEDATPAPGWSIADRGQYYNPNSGSWEDNGGDLAWQIAVIGTIIGGGP